MFTSGRGAPLTPPFYLEYIVYKLQKSCPLELSATCTCTCSPTVTCSLTYPAVPTLFAYSKNPLGRLGTRLALLTPSCPYLHVVPPVLPQVNNEKVRNYLHSDLVTVLKRCNKGNQAAFSVLRAPPPQQEVGRCCCMYASYCRLCICLHYGFSLLIVVQWNLSIVDTLGT